MADFDKEMLYEQLNNFQIQRHDFLNFFQVIKGYLQLKMPDKALNYIDDVLEDIRPQQDIYRIGNKTLLGLLLGWYFMLRLKGIKYRLEFPPEMKNEEFWEKHWREEYAQSFFGYTKECSDMSVMLDPEGYQGVILLGSLEGGFTCDYGLFKGDTCVKQKSYTTGQ
ncbi:Spo0B domain-containing protein [Dehalobacter sp. DCM]|uniref:Spo0B domain-containing protein n=1 Tax=Dehalobacter sp. DCM TaxID=2907827 RepID=UPI003081B6D9|nr:Spo0B domain-containing protein [Dehalobacter sp. DCM]